MPTQTPKSAGQAKERFHFAVRQALPLSLFTVVTLFIFGPIDLYYANLDNFWFAFPPLILPMLALAAACFAAMLAVLTLLGTLLPKRVFGLMAAFAFGLALAAYIQGSFFSATLRLVNGDSINWTLDRGDMLMSSAVWLVLLFASVLCYMLKAKTTLSVMRFICYALVGVQLITGAVPVIIHGSGHDAEEQYLSEDGLYDLSAGKNVVVFMPDTLDTRFMDEIIADHPETLQALDGFTYYRNMGGTFPMTDGSLSFFFTGEKYLNQMPFHDFMREKLAASPLLNTLRDNSFDIRMKFEESITDDFAPDALDNLGVAATEITSRRGLVKEWLILMAYRYAPTAMRPYFFKDFNTEFDDLRATSRDSGQDAAAHRDSLVLNRINALGLHLMEGRNAFRFITLRGGHSPYNTNHDGQRVSNNSISRIEAIQGSFKVISTYVDMMKAAGVYDQSAIVIMADHGFGPVCNPSFLIKYPNEHGALRTSEAPVSQDDLTATFLKAAGCANYADYGTPVDEWAEDAVRQRFFYQYMGTQSKMYAMYFAPITEYAYDGHAADLDSYQPTGNIY